MIFLQKIKKRLVMLRIEVSEINKNSKDEATQSDAVVNEY